MGAISLVNGPNIDKLGERQPEVYGQQRLNELVAECTLLAGSLGHRLRSFQSNAEHLLIEAINEMTASTDFLILNPAALSHTSVALRDAVLGSGIPFIEVHISNLYRRESFRHHSYFRDIAVGSIVGLGTYGYQLAVMAAHQYLQHGNLYGHSKG